jgi:T5SS/PEP-CTERM-associated repeat protein
MGGEVRRIGWSAAWGSILLGAAAQGEAFHWIEPAGGLFSVPAHWSPPLRVPRRGDDAIFDLDASYTVDFARDEASRSLLVQRGDVLFALGGTEYEVASLALSNPPDDPAAPGVRLRIQGGTLDASEAGVLTNDAVLRVEDGTRLIAGDTLLGISGVGTLSGTGSLEVAAGGFVLSADAWLGYDQGGSEGRATLEGTDAQWTVLGRLAVGFDNQGELRVRDGALLSTSEAAVADLSATASCCGLAVVSGLGAEWRNARALEVGSATFGELRIEDGGLVVTHDALLGRGDPSRLGTGSEGAVHVEGEESLLRATDSLVLGGDLGAPRSPLAAVGPGGFGSLRVAGGARVWVGQRLLLWNGAQVELAGGSVDVGPAPGVAAEDQVRVLRGRLLGGSGAIGGSVRLAGVLDPGGPAGAPGINEALVALGYAVGPARRLDVAGDLAVEDAARVEIDVAGGGAGEGYDAVVVAGAVALAGSLTLRVADDQVDGIAASDVFTVLEAGGGLSGAFANVASGGRVPLSGRPGSFQVFYGPGSGAVPNPYDPDSVVLTDFLPVPEPGQALLVAVGWGVLAAPRRRRRAPGGSREEGRCAAS